MMITDLKEIEIYNIKDINLIYFYVKPYQNKESDKLYTGLKVVYNDSTKTLEYDYKSPYYGLLCHQVLSLYEQEKEKKDIILLGDFTSEVINNYSLVKDSKLDFYFSSLSKEKIPRNDKFLEAFESIEPFLIEAFQQIFYCFYSNEQVKIDSVNHLKNRYTIHFISPVDKYIPFSISNKNNIAYIKTQLLENDMILPIEISIENKLDEIKTYWHLTDYDLCGHIVTMIKNDMTSFESAIISDGTTIFLEKDKISVVEDSAIKQKILFYLSLSNINVDSSNIYKLSTELEQYVIVNSVLDNQEEKKCSVLICFRDNSVKVEMKKELLFIDQEHNMNINLDDVKFIDTYSLKTYQINSVLEKKREFKDSIYLNRINKPVDDRFYYISYELPYYDSIDQIDYNTNINFVKTMERR